MNFRFISNLLIVDLVNMSILFLMITIHIQIQNSPVGWGCRIHQQYLCRGLKPPCFNKCPGYDTKPSFREAPILELWGKKSTPSLPLLPGLLWPRVVAPVRVLSMHQIELFNHLTVCKQMTDVKLNCLCYIAVLETI